MELKLFCARRPDGSMVPMQPQETEEYALAAVPEFEREKRPVSGDQLRVGVTPEARCWRAYGNCYNWPRHLAVEIATLMGYTAVQVRVEPTK